VVDIFEFLSNTTTGDNAPRCAVEDTCEAFDFAETYVRSLFILLLGLFFGWCKPQKVLNMGKYLIKTSGFYFFAECSTVRVDFAC
jgi:hypothetical protein